VDRPVRPRHRQRRDRSGDLRRFGSDVDPRGPRRAAQRLNAQTALYAVLGTPIAHSLSPALHNAAFRAERRNAVYVACDVGEADLAEALRGLLVLGARGANLTAPLKIRALALADEVTPQ